MPQKTGSHCVCDEKTRFPAGFLAGTACSLFEASSHTLIAVKAMFDAEVEGRAGSSV